MEIWFQDEARVGQQGTLERVPIKWNHLIDKDAAQNQRVGACPDRKSRATFSGHALTRIWAKRGSRPRDQRYEWTYIFGAVCPARGATAALVLPNANTEAFSLHLAEISKQVASGAHAVPALDGAGYHAAADLAMPDNITLLPLPSYSPELNPMENVWEYLRKNKLAITLFNEYHHIVDKSCEAWNFFADDKPAIASITCREWAQVNP